MTSEQTDRLFIVATNGRQVVIREFDPAQHPLQARAAYGNYSRPEAWALANRRAASCPKHVDPIQRKARDIVFVDLDGEQRIVQTAMEAVRVDAPAHHYTVTLLVRKTGEQIVTQEQASNKKQATDAARAKITSGATTLVSCVKGERIDAPAAKTETTTPAAEKLPWE